MVNEKFMDKALELATEAFNDNEVPVGAVVVKDGEVIGVGRNYREHKQNALSHAEIEAIDNACKNIHSWRLDNCDLYVTLEPCPMCAGAIINARIKNVYIGAKDQKNGAVGSVTNLFEYPFTHRPVYFYGIREEQCKNVLTKFFKDKR